MFTRKQSRDGYTLIELLVVISLMAVLAALTILFIPNAASSAREARAAVQLQGWLSIAKQRALRDQAPRGLRLWIPSGSLQVVECQYTEQPDDFAVGTITSNATGDTINFNFGSTGTDLLNGYSTAAADVKYWNVQPGDYLEVLGTGLMHQISPTGTNTATISPALPFPIASATPNYRIVRAPRPVGDETLKLPDGTAIDLQTNNTYGNAPPWVYEPGNATAVAVDILFAPSGAVISRGISTANIHLWVRAPDPSNPANNEFSGDPTIVSVFVRTGFTGAYPINRSGSPYSLVN